MQFVGNGLTNGLPVPWFLHHDNAPCHAAPSVREFLAKHIIPVVPHAPYSPDLALNLLPLPQAEEYPEGETISRRREDTTKAIPKQDYQTCIEKRKDRWNRRIRSGGSYFEGDNFE
jgi:hypothetical protein